MRIRYILIIVALLVGLVLVINFVSSSQTLEEEKHDRRLEILKEYRNGEITQEESIIKMRKLSCEIAERSGAKYNKEICKQWEN